MDIDNLRNRMEKRQGYYLLRVSGSEYHHMRCTSSLGQWQCYQSAMFSARQNPNLESLLSDGAVLIGDIAVLVSESDIHEAAIMDVMELLG